MSLQHGYSPLLISSLGLLACLLTSCSGRSTEERAREAEKKMKESLGPDIEGLAIAQNISSEDAKKVQEELSAIHEYQGETNGKLDGVTVNAIQAFQRSAGLEDNGMLDARTRERLQTAAAAAKQQTAARGSVPAGS